MKREHMCEYEPPCFGGHYRCTGEAAWVYRRFRREKEWPYPLLERPFFCCADHAPFVKQRPRISIQEYEVQRVMET